MPGRTLYKMFQETVSRYPDKNAVGFRTSKEAPFTYWSYRELDRRVQLFRSGLDILGLKKGDRIALLSLENRVEWAVADFASQSLGLITVPIYGSLTSSQIAHYLIDSNSRAIVTQDEKQRRKITEIRPNIPSMEFFISMTESQEVLNEVNSFAFDTIMEKGAKEGREKEYLDSIAESLTPDDIASLLYTSGTTGEPKGTILTHTSLLHTCDSVAIDNTLKLGADAVFLSFLPLSHITERVGGHYLPLSVGACIVYSLGLSAFADELQKSVRPTCLLCVPRLWESIHTKALDSIKKAPPKQKKIALWAIRIGEERARRLSENRFVSPLLSIQFAIADKLALQKLRERTTGGRMRYCVSGGAPLDPRTATFFIGIGIQLLEGYGLSETGIISINRPHKQRIGTVGNLMYHTEVKIGVDGEILMRGQGEMKGYYNNPEFAREFIDEEGWFHTGDVGELSSDGYLKITDRIKDILVLSLGKKIAPQSIEAVLKRSSYIAEAVLFGDRQPVVSALIVPDQASLREWAKGENINEEDYSSLLGRPETIMLFRTEIDRLSAELAEYERIRGFRLIEGPFTIEGGELTPTLKVRRKVIAQKYAAELAYLMK